MTYRPARPEDRAVVDLIVDQASGIEFLGIEGRIVTETEALEAMGARIRSGYPVDPSKMAVLDLIRRLPGLPAIVNTSRTAYALAF